MPRQIILIDDDEDILFVMQTILSEQGYEVITDKDGELINMLNRDYEGIILLDITLQKADGRFICNLLKTQEHTIHIPVIFVSAAPDLKEICTSCGANGYIEKPFDNDDFTAVVKNCFNKIA